MSEIQSWELNFDDRYFFWHQGPIKIVWQKLAKVYQKLGWGKYFSNAWCQLVQKKFLIVLREGTKETETKNWTITDNNLSMPIVNFLLFSICNICNFNYIHTYWTLPSIALQIFFFFSFLIRSKFKMELEKAVAGRHSI